VYKRQILKDANKLSSGSKVGVELAYSSFSAVVETVTKKRSTRYE